MLQPSRLTPTPLEVRQSLLKNDAHDLAPMVVARQTLVEVMALLVVVDAATCHSVLAVKVASLRMLDVVAFSSSVERSLVV